MFEMFQNNEDGADFSVRKFVFVALLVAFVLGAITFNPGEEFQVSIIVENEGNYSWVVTTNSPSMFKWGKKSNAGDMCGVSFEGEFYEERRINEILFVRYVNPSPVSNGKNEDFCPDGSIFVVDAEGERELWYKTLEVRDLVRHVTNGIYL